MPGNTISKVTAAHRSVLDDLLCRVRRFFALHLFAFRGALYTHLAAHSRRTYMHIFCLLSICDITKFAESQFIYNRGCFSSVRIGSSYRLERKGARSGSERCIPSKYTIDPKIISNIQFLVWSRVWVISASHVDERLYEPLKQRRRQMPFRKMGYTRIEVKTVTIELLWAGFVVCRRPATRRNLPNIMSVLYFDMVCELSEI